MSLNPFLKRIDKNLIVQKKCVDKESSTISFFIQFIDQPASFW